MLISDGEYIPGARRLIEAEWAALVAKSANPAQLGASGLQILTKIVLPLAVLGLISAGIFAFTLS